VLVNPLRFEVGPFWLDPVFWITLVVLESYWLAGAIAASKRHRLTVGQARRFGIQKVLPYLWHFGMLNDLGPFHFFLASIVQMYWEEWRTEPEVLVLCLILGGIVGARAQWGWSRSTLNEDGALVRDEAQSEKGLPSSVGIIHITHMQPLFGILFMFGASVLQGWVSWWMMGAGLCFIVAHAIMAIHWPLRIKLPAWAPPQLKELGPESKVFIPAWTVILLIAGFYILFTATP